MNINNLNKTTITNLFLKPYLFLERKKYLNLCGIKYFCNQRYSNNTSSLFILTKKFNNE